MKKTVLLLTALFIVVSLVSCDNRDNAEYTTAEYGKESVDEFMSAFGSLKVEGLISGYTFDSEHCYNVTPSQVKNETNMRIFKFYDSCASFVLIDGVP